MRPYRIGPVQPGQPMPLSPAACRQFEGSEACSPANLHGRRGCFLFRRFTATSVSTLARQQISALTKPLPKNNVFPSPP